MRERRAKVRGTQTGVTPFDWFGIGVQYALHGFQDDATGDILALYLCEHECLQGYFEAFRAVLQGYGVPEALYADSWERKIIPAYHITKDFTTDKSVFCLISCYRFINFLCHLLCRFRGKAGLFHTLPGVMTAVG
jgi:hypothetical protein